jgi:hypothetical protein
MKKTPSATEVRKTLRPGAPGTHHHLRDWGARLVCVRHRVDTTKGVRFTTVEVVASAERVTRPKRALHPEALVYARVGVSEWKLAKRLRSANAATYDAFLDVWRMRYETAVRLKLKRRILLRRPAPPGFRARAIQNSNIPAHRNLDIPTHPRQNPPRIE